MAVMTFEDFAQLVHDMREAQRQFFRTRDRSDVVRSKVLERKVDDALDEIFDKQPKLF